MRVPVATGLLLRAGRLQVASTANGQAIAGEPRGEMLDRSRHEVATDVKAVTLHELRVTRLAAGWSAQVTVDV